MNKMKEFKRNVSRKFEDTLEYAEDHQDGLMIVLAGAATLISGIYTIGYFVRSFKK